MKTNEEMQSEDSPSLEPQPIPAQPPAKPESKTKPDFFRRAIPWVVTALVFFLVGGCLVYFTLYRTVSRDLQASKVNADQLSQQLSAAEVDLQKAKSDLTTTQNSLTEKSNELTKSQELLTLYKLQSDVNVARVSLEKSDPSSVRQALSITKTDLASLSNSSLPADTLAGLQPQIDAALAGLDSDVSKAQDALDTLYTNLLLITDSLK